MKIMLSILLMLAATNAFAACNQNACDTTISRLYATGFDDGRIFIEPEGDISPLNCSAVNNVFLTLKKNHPLFNEIYSMLLSATIAKSDVRVRMVENSSDCQVAYAWIVSN